MTAGLADIFDRHERVFLAFSGGKDSLALAHLCEPWRDRLTLLWVNTGHMAPHMAEFVRVHRDRFELIELAPGRPMFENWRDVGTPADILPLEHLAGVDWRSPRLQPWTACCGVHRVQSVITYLGRRSRSSPWAAYLKRTYEQSAMQSDTLQLPSPVLWGKCVFLISVTTFLFGSYEVSAFDPSTSNTPTHDSADAGRLVVQRQLIVPRIQVGPTVDSGEANPIYSYIPESVASPQNVFGPSHVFVINRQPGGSGNREAIHAEANVNGGFVGEQIVGGMLRGAIISGAGTAYGVNPYCLVNAGVSPGSQCIGSETNVDARQDLAAKVGIQVIDVGTSIGRGTSIDVAYLAGTQLGGTGFGRGFQFGYSDQVGTTDLESQYPVRSGGTLIYSIPTARVLNAGLDLSKLVNPTSDAAIKLPIGDRIRFGEGGAGGTVASMTNNSAGTFIFGANVSVIDFGGAQQHRFTPGEYATSGTIRADGGLRTGTISSNENGTGVLTGAFRRSIDPTTMDIPDGQCADWHNLSSNTFRHVCNFSGVLRGIALK